MRSTVLIFFLLFATIAPAQGPDYELPIKVGEFQQQIQKPYTTKQGLPSNHVMQISIDRQGRILAKTKAGWSVFNEDRWQSLSEEDVHLPSQAQLSPKQTDALQKQADVALQILDVAQNKNEFAVATDAGLYIGNSNSWELAMPRQNDIRWAPVDVRAVVYDANGELWFAAHQGVGHRISKDEWLLFTGQEGLPYNDFTCMAAGSNSVWMGTTNGAIRYQNGEWSFRQGRRWLLDNHVLDITIDTNGNAWIATSKGVSCIASTPMSLAKKAAFFENELEKYHRRTRFGYINPARLEVAGDKSTATPKYTDNDGHWIGTYLAAVSLAYAVTNDPQYKEHAHKAFKALTFLSEVTQGGSHQPPEGFFSRVIMPTSGPDPNPDFDLNYDIRRHKADTLWKIIQPRWPIDKTGEWYWKNDSSADELDGHFLGYGAYYDHVCETEAEKDAVRKAVRRTSDHILNNGYNLVDYDGTPTRWGRFSPDDMNRNSSWVVERGLRCNSVLNYLLVTWHITGDEKYRKEYLKLALDEGYAMNGMTQPRDIVGAGTEGSHDDKMAFMNYYHLLRYETDPKLLNMYQWAIHRHWEVEQYEKSPWANFIYAACCMGKERTDQWRTTDLTPPESSLLDAIDTLKRYPLDLLNWPMSNAHRIDMVPLKPHLGHDPGTAGYRVDGYVFPIDERHVIRWGYDPYKLTGDGDGKSLQEGIHYLFAYYVGLAHGLIQE